ncbi:MAG: DUF308 domain-containing protein [Mogibacterium sp.]|nr:DUF308 domain-containing protein [Mogibacterium sp.]
MTKFGRIREVVKGLVTVLFSVLLFAEPSGGLLIILMILGISFTLKGLHALFYYFTMARSMVGGRSALYRGILFLELGIFTSSLENNPLLYIVLYLVGVHAFYGGIDILRSLEARSVGSPRWKYRLVYGITNLVLAGAVLIGGAVYASFRVVVYIYAAGLIYSAFVRIASAFRRTSIVYIQ